MDDYVQTEFFPPSSAVDSHAKTSQIPADERVYTVNGQGFGRRCFDCADMYGQRGSLLKMYQPYKVEGLPWSYKISGRSGTMRNGTVFRLPPLQKLPTKGTGSGLLPTPAAHEARLGYQNRKNGKKGTQLSLTTVIIDMLGGRSKVRGQIHPCLFEYMMGFPIGHTDCDS